MSLTKTSFSMISGMYANVMDFGAVGDGVTDDTAAFVAAQVASKDIYAPPGTYVLNGLRIQNGVQLIGAGY
jgi:polygalacturonase